MINEEEVIIKNERHPYYHELLKIRKFIKIMKDFDMQIMSNSYRVIKCHRAPDDCLINYDADIADKIGNEFEKISNHIRKIRSMLNDYQTCVENKKEY